MIVPARMAWVAEFSGELASALRRQDWSRARELCGELDGWLAEVERLTERAETSAERAARLFAAGAETVH